MNTLITNALIRCTRNDRIAQSAFELVREAPPIWVRELPETIDEILADLLTIRALLLELGTGSSDYTLHLAAILEDHHKILLPPELSELAGACGFVIEVISATS